MTINNHLHTQGTKFSRGAGTPLVYTQVAQVIGVPIPAIKRKALDVTTQDQADNHMQYVGAVLIENEPVSFELLYDPASAQQSALAADFGTPEPVPYQITLRNGDTYAFLGVLTAWTPDGKLNDVYKVKVTIQISGAVTFTAGVGA